MLAERASANNFELKALRMQFEQQGLRVDLARKARIPMLGVGPYYDRARSDRGQRPCRDDQRGWIRRRTPE